MDQQLFATAADDDEDRGGSHDCDHYSTTVTSLAVFIVSSVGIAVELVS